MDVDGKGPVYANMEYVEFRCARSLIMVCWVDSVLPSYIQPIAQRAREPM